MANAKPAMLPSKETQIVTPIFRLSFPSVFEAKWNELAKRNQYSIVMLFDKKNAAELAALKVLMGKVASHRFGNGVKGLINPLKDGDTARNTAGELISEKNPAAKGMFVLSSWSKNKPGVVNASNQIIIDADEVYGGCFCRAQLNCYAYDKGQNRGIAFGLLNLQKVKDGDPFGSRTRAEDAFTPVENGDSLAEETAAGDAMFS